MYSIFVHKNNLLCKFIEFIHGSFVNVNQHMYFNTLIDIYPHSTIKTNLNYTWWVYYHQIDASRIKLYCTVF